MSEKLLPRIINRKTLAVTLTLGALVSCGPSQKETFGGVNPILPHTITGHDTDKLASVTSATAVKLKRDGNGNHELDVCTPSGDRVKIPKDETLVLVGNSPVVSADTTTENKAEEISQELQNGLSVQDVLQPDGIVDETIQSQIQKLVDSGKYNGTVFVSGNTVIGAKSKFDSSCPQPKEVSGVGQARIDRPVVPIFPPEE